MSPPFHFLVCFLEVDVTLLDIPINAGLQLLLSVFKMPSQFLCAH